MVPDPARVLRCTRCGLDLDTRVVPYLFVKSGWRGRCRSPWPSGKRPANRSAVLCSVCGREYRDTMREYYLRCGTFVGYADMIRDRGVVLDEG